MEVMSDFLNTHRGREKVLRLIQFAAGLSSGCVRSLRYSNGEGLQSVASSIGSTRTVLRLFDDVSVISSLITVIQQLKSEYTIYNLLDLASSLTGIIFLSVEHVAYFGDLKILPLDTKPLHILTVKVWISSLVINITQLLIRFYNNSETRCSFFLSLIQYVSDFIMAVHFLPSGFLWSNTLTVTTVGLLGVISSVIGLYKCIN